MAILEQIQLTFTRYGDTIEDEYGNIQRSQPMKIGAIGNLQPLRSGQTSEILPEGRRVSDGRVFYTKTQLNAANPRTQQPADECEIGGRKFEVHDVADWSTNSSIMAHYEVILFAKEV